MVVTLVNKITGEQKHIKVGWSWTCFFFSTWFGIPLFLRRLHVWGSLMCVLWFAMVAAIILLADNMGPMMAVSSSFQLLFLGFSIWFGLKANRMAFIQYLEDGWEPLDPASSGYALAKRVWKLEEMSAHASMTKGASISTTPRPLGGQKLKMGIIATAVIVSVVAAIGIVIFRSSQGGELGKAQELIRLAQEMEQKDNSVAVSAPHANPELSPSVQGAPSEKPIISTAGAVNDETVGEFIKSHPAGSFEFVNTEVRLTIQGNLMTQNGDFMFVHHNPGMPLPGGFQDVMINCLESKGMSSLVVGAPAIVLGSGIQLVPVPDKRGKEYRIAIPVCNILQSGHVETATQPEQLPQAAEQTTVKAEAPASATTGAGTTKVSPSFDCGKAGTTIEKQICASPRLSSLDAKLTETYKELQHFVDKNELRSEQVAWVKIRNGCTDSACLQQAYEERLSELEDHLVRQQRAAGEKLTQ